MTKQYYLSVGAVFKNENHAIKEWIDHYLARGVDHFYLINDNSTDSFRKTIQPYVDNKDVTLYHCNEPKYNGRQRSIYWKNFSPILINQETKWLIIVDLDEFLYSPQQVSISNILKNYEEYGQIIVDWVPFGSNGHVKQPDSIVKGFTMTKNLNSFTQTKYIVNSSFPCFDLGVHMPSVNGPSIELSWRSNRFDPVFLINHYSIQSEEFWMNIKMTRGDADCHLKTDDRNMLLFKTLDINDIEDTKLLKQNENMDKFVYIQKYPTHVPYNFPYFPTNTFHQYAQNFPGGSKYGEDGILNMIIKQLKLNRRHVIISPTFIEALPDTHEAYSLLVPFISQWWKGNFIFSGQSGGYLDNTFTQNEKMPSYLDVEKRVIQLVKNNHSNSVKNCCFLSLPFSTWLGNIDTPYYQDGAPFIIALHITHDILTFENFVDMVLECSNKHYHAIALTKKYLICIRAEQVHKLQPFPCISFSITKKYIGALALLYTNLYYYQNKWCVDQRLNIEVAKRNFYIKNKSMPTDKDLPFLQSDVDKYSHEIISDII